MLRVQPGGPGGMELLELRGSSFGSLLQRTWSTVFKSVATVTPCYTGFPLAQRAE